MEHVPMTLVLIALVLIETKERSRVYLIIRDIVMAAIGSLNCHRQVKDVTGRLRLFIRVKDLGNFCCFILHVHGPVGKEFETTTIATTTITTTTEQQQQQRCELTCEL